MSKQTLTLASIDNDGDSVVYTFNCKFTVTTAGDGCWGCEAGRKVKVTGICIVHNAYEDGIITMVNVVHDSTWDIYTDSGFEAAISEAVGFRVSFTEQGMQEDEYASMEA